MKTSLGNVLLLFASWEERFVQGALRDLDEVEITEVVLFYFSSYSSDTEGGRAKIQSECNRRSLPYHQIELDPETPHQNLLILHETISGLSAKLPVVVDISTMPREVIWHIFWLCEDREGAVRYRYYSPNEYSSSWLSKDPGRPRLVHKLSGIALPQVKTLLLLAVGYDVQRVSQLVRFFEPSKLILSLQPGSKFSGNASIMEDYERGLDGVGAYETFYVDAFASDHGYGVFKKELNSFIDNYNIVVGSLGPKLSAVSLYRIHRHWSQIALVYAPAREFNREYSHGIGDLYQGTLKS